MIVGADGCLFVVFVVSYSLCVLCGEIAFLVLVFLNGRKKRNERKRERKKKTHRRVRSEIGYNFKKKA